MKTTRLSFLFAALAAASCGGSQQGGQGAQPAPASQGQGEGEPTAAADEGFRAQAPEPGPVPPLVAPVPEKQQLANGLTVLVVPKSDLPLVHLRVIVKSGSAQDPADRPGLATFVGELLRSGTKKRSATQIAAEVELRGSSLHVDVDSDDTTVSFTALKENYLQVFDVLADVLTASTFASDEIERTRKLVLAAVAQEKQEPRAAAGRVYSRVVFGSHPYGRPATGDEKSVAKINQADLIKYFTTHFRPQNAAVVVVGDLTAAEARAVVEQRLGAWTGKPGVQPPPPAASMQPARMVVLDKPEAPQSQLRVGHLGVERAHPDFFAITMMNAILGGLFNSRINMNLRENKGFTYGARSYFDFRRSPGTFTVATGVRTDATVPALREVLLEIERIRKEPVAPAELQHAKNSYTLSLPGYFQNLSTVAGTVGNLYVYDLALDYYQRLPERIAAVTVGDVQRVAVDHLKPQDLSIVVVGSQQAVAAGLGELGRGQPQSVDADGNPLR